MRLKKVSLLLPKVGCAKEITEVAVGTRNLARAAYGPCLRARCT